MLEHNELARALTELPDDLLLEETQTARRKKPVKFRRLIAVVAVIVMLAGTVGAVSAGISGKVERVSYLDLIQRFGGIYEEYYNDPSLGFDKLKYSVPLEVTELPEENMEILRTLTWRAGLGSGGEAVDFYVRHRNGHYSRSEEHTSELQSLL